MSKHAAKGKRKPATRPEDKKQTKPPFGINRPVLGKKGK